MILTRFLIGLRLVLFLGAQFGCLAAGYHVCGGGLTAVFTLPKQILWDGDLLNWLVNWLLRQVHCIPQQVNLFSTGVLLVLLVGFVIAAARQFYHLTYPTQSPNLLERMLTSLFVSAGISIWGWWWAKILGVPRENFVNFRFLKIGYVPDLAETKNLFVQKYTYEVYAFYNAHPWVRAQMTRLQFHEFVNSRQKWFIDHYLTDDVLLSSSRTELCDQAVRVGITDLIRQVTKLSAITPPQPPLGWVIGYIESAAHWVDQHPFVTALVTAAAVGALGWWLTRPPSIISLSDKEPETSLTLLQTVWFKTISFVEQGSFNFKASFNDQKITTAAYWSPPPPDTPQTYFLSLLFRLGREVKHQSLTLIVLQEFYVSICGDDNGQSFVHRVTKAFYSSFKR